MIELLTGAALSLISLLVGFKLGKDQAMITPDTKKQIQQIFRRVVPNTEVGPVARPTSQQNFYRDNPQIAAEDQAMTGALDDLNRPQSQ